MDLPEFSLAIELTGPAAARELLGEVVARVLAQAGVAAADVPAIQGSVRAEVDKAAGRDGRHCGVRFRLHRGQLDIVVSNGHDAVWDMSRRVP